MEIGVFELACHRLLTNSFCYRWWNADNIAFITKPCDCLHGSKRPYNVLSLRAHFFGERSGWTWRTPKWVLAKDSPGHSSQPGQSITRMNVRNATSYSISLKSILFATDFSAASMQAMPYATAIAGRFNSKLFLVHVVPPEDYASGCKSLEEAAQVACRDAKAKLDSLLQSASCRDVVCETEVGSGDIWLGLSEFMGQHAIDLLVMGTVGYRGAKKVFLGSVAEEAIRESRCPALTVGPQIKAPRTTDFRQILYATDFSDDSLAGLPYALSFAERYASRLVLVHALEGLSESLYLDGRMATVHLRELVPSGLPAGVPEVIVELGSPANVIIEAAQKVAADLIVIGARGAGSLARLASHFGSVAHKIVCRVPCPVLTVRRFGENGSNQTQTARTRH